MTEKEPWFQYGIESRSLTKKELYKFQLWKLIDFFFFKPSFKFLKSYRVWLLRLFGAKIGKNCYIAASATIDVPWHFQMGNKCTIDEHCFLNGYIKLEDNVCIGNHVCMYGGQHDVTSRRFDAQKGEIIIGNGVFIGGRVTVLPGVHIKQMAVIGAGTVVYQNVPENTIFMEMRKYAKFKRLKDEEYEKYRYNV